MKRLTLIAFLLAGAAHAAPFVTSDPYPSAATPKPSICSIYLDSATTGTDSPVTTDASGTYCHYDIASVSVGAHTVKAKFAIVDPVWGRQESGFSNTVNFTKPVAPGAPANLTLSPN